MNKAQHSHAVVIGGSVAGLLAARALADHFDRVTIIERDVLTTTPVPRKGVPQGNHAHALLKSGENILNEFFPGFTDALIAKGAQQVDFARDVAWYHHGGWKLRFESRIRLVGQTRPLLESTVVEFLRQYQNIDWKTGWSTQELLTTQDKSRVVGIRVQTDDGTTEELFADLVIDASGRGSKTPRWLETMGYAAPQETIVKINLQYATRMYEVPADFHGEWSSLVINAFAPHHPRGGYIFGVENNTWIVMLAGYGGETMPDDDASFLEFARSLQMPDVYNAIKDAKPLTDVKVIRYTAGQRRHYELLKRMPEGFAVIGDAFCSFDPVFGQGMSSAANQAKILHQLLATMSPSQASFSRKYHQRVGKFLNVPWMMATSEDFRFPTTEGKMGFITPIMNRYTAQIFKLATHDKQIGYAFVQAMNLIAPPTVLFAPSIVVKVIGSLFTRNAHEEPAKITTQTIKAV